jgi:hypothetical protein
MMLKSHKQNALGKPVVAQTVAVAGVSAKNGTAFTHSLIRFYPTADMTFKVGVSPTATATDHFAPAGQWYPEIFLTDSDEIAFLGTGTVYISELV